MLRLSRDIQIEEFILDGVVNIEIESSWDMLTDVCRMTFPRKVDWLGKSIAFGSESKLNKGDTVNIALGYDDENDVAFQGFVTSISSKIPVEIKCEDHAWLLKQKTHTLSFADANLKDVLAAILPANIDVVAPDLRLGPFRLSKATAAQTFDYIRKQFFQKAFFRDGTLYVGFAYQAGLQKAHTLRFDINVVDNSLDFVLEEDVKIKLKIINITPGNQREEFEFGDQEGEQRTLHYYDKNEADIKMIGEEEIKRMKYTGYRGSLTTFGKPFINHGDEVKLVDLFYPERDGRYLVKKVLRTFGIDGYRQQLELDIKIG